MSIHSQFCLHVERLGQIVLFAVFFYLVNSFLQPIYKVGEDDRKRKNVDVRLVFRGTLQVKQSVSMLGEIPINLHFCNRLGPLHQLAPIVEDVG